MASTDQKSSAEDPSQIRPSLESERNWPGDRKQAFQRLYDDYTRQAASLRRIAMNYLFLTFLLLTVGAVAVVNAPLLARQDVEMETPKELRMKVIETMQQLMEVENELDGLRFADFTDVAIGTEHSIIVGSDGTLLMSGTNQTGWRYRPSDTRANINATAIDRSGENAIAVGDGGTISVLGLRSGWTVRDNVLETKDFNDVVLRRVGSRPTAIAVGDDGIIVVSHDNGRTWHRRATGLVGHDLNAVAFVGPTDTVIAVGDKGVVLISTDGGNQWNVRDPGPTHGEDLYAIATFSTNWAVAAGENGTIRVSTDRGQTWSHRGIRDTRHDFLAVALSSNGRFGVAVGDDGLLAIFRGNFTNWVLHTKNIKERLNSIVIDPNGKTAVAAGEGGTIIVSPDEGHTWLFIEKKSRNEIRALSFDGKVAMFVGENSTILRGEISAGQRAQNMEFQIISSSSETSARKMEIQAQKRRLEELLTALKIFEEKTAAEAEKLQTELVQYIFFQTNALRVGILVILIFLSQHLMVLARYQLRLAEFYHARASVLMMTSQAVSWSSLTTDEFQHLMRAFSPEGVEFGATPRSVVDMAVDLTKSILRRTG